jgi:hypothetical protein
MMGPVFGLEWARRVVPAAATTSFRSLIPVYILFLLWVWFGSLTVRGETHDVLVSLGTPWEPSIFWASVADPVGYGAVTTAIVC